jgi:hypothetical protein
VTKNPRERHKARRRADHAANGESIREYLDVEIGRMALGEPIRTVLAIARELGCSRSLVWYVERDLLLKIGRALREDRATEESN